MSDVATIGIVDDDAHLCQALANLVRSYGYDVHTFLSAGSFLSFELIGSIDVLVTDAEMPGMDGFDLSLEIGRAGRSFPVILMSAKMDQDMVDKAAAFGIHACLAKPFAADQLIEAITDVMGN